MNSEYIIGIDCGSTLCKGVLLKKMPGNFSVDTFSIEKFYMQPTGWELAESASKTAAELSGSGAGGILPIVISTGYGRGMVGERTKSVTEISAHACGADYLMPGVRTVIDIGGQDCKVISVELGKVKSFQMNDKCAAGTGRFVQMVMERFGTDVSGMDKLLACGKSIRLNSTCTVFAESEIIGLLAKGCSREEILGGAVQSLAIKISSLSQRVGINEPAVLTGGLSESEGIRKALSQTLGIEVQHMEHGIYAGAIGAAICYYKI
ncbi:MAG: acyl-CoA dehydratase activase [Termitinemataceae bacterium]|nr:MAG: acyl-CoA dehydratase activase [Termitinemataceae bacterium]